MSTSDHSAVLARIVAGDRSRETIAAALSIDDPGFAADLCACADRIRKERMGEGILLRGIVEFSNVCRNACVYCGLRRDNSVLRRYRLSEREIFDAVSELSAAGIRTVVLQSGESDETDPGWLAGMISDIKRSFPVAVTLCAGEQTEAVYRQWRQAGADRYLLKIETSNPVRYAALHAGMCFENRLRCLRVLRSLGYQTGSGNIVGLPAQTAEDLADDILFFRREACDMIGIGPFIPHPGTPLAGAEPGSGALSVRVVALARIVNPDAHIPATTAMGSLERDFRPDALSAGANVLMPNFTPAPYRYWYELYPGKRCVEETAAHCVGCMEGMARAMGRAIDRGIGHARMSLTV